MIYGDAVNAPAPSKPYAAKMIFYIMVIPSVCIIPCRIENLLFICNHGIYFCSGAVSFVQNSAELSTASLLHLLNCCPNRRVSL